jgi:hypothetical protein
MCCRQEINVEPVGDPDPLTVAAIIATKARAASPYCSVSWHQFQAPRRGWRRMAFSLRHEHFDGEIIAGWRPDGDAGAAHRRRAQDL